MSLLKCRELALIIGPCGAGKSTYARAHYPEHARPEREGMIRAMTPDGALHYYPALRAIASALQDLAVASLFARGYAVCVTDGGATRAERARWVGMAANVPCHVIRLVVSPATAIARAASDPTRPQTSKGKWPKIVQNWYRRWESPDPAAEGLASYLEVAWE
ncbi:MAG: AAA family ATPase [Rhodospirillales bacterium]|nr:AAA family ATPase [Rhodospirillales bacterium]